MNADINALLGAGSEFEGKLTFEGTVRIDGRFRGEIFSDGTLIVGEGARVEAALRVGTVLVYGEVIGNINATNGVELHAPASLKGNITSPALHIDKGVFFDGSCQMSTGAPEPAAKAADAQRMDPAPRMEPPPRMEPTARPEVLHTLPDRAPPQSSGAARTISGLYQSERGPGGKPIDFKHEF